MNKDQSCHHYVATHQGGLDYTEQMFCWSGGLYNQSVAHMCAFDIGAIKTPRQTTVQKFVV